MKMLQIETLVLGMIQTNCYLAMNKETREILIVDPAAEVDRIVQKIRELQAKPAMILLTHGHFDHIGAVDVLREQYGIPACALAEEQPILERQTYNLSAVYGHGYSVKADRFFHDGEIVETAGVSIQVFHTPGHTAGGACYYIASEKVLFSGDTLFCGSVGRTDFPTGNVSALHNSLHQKLFVLPDDTLVLPGHDEPTTIGYEKQYNPY